MFEGQFPIGRPRGNSYKVGTRYRVPDLTLTSGEIVESKFVKKQGLTKQIQDGVERAGAGRYILVTAPNTHITRGLRKLIDSGAVVHETMPASTIEALVP